MEELIEIRKAATTQVEVDNWKEKNEERFMQLISTRMNAIVKKSREKGNSLAQ